MFSTQPLRLNGDEKNKMKKLKAFCLIIQVLFFVNKSVQDLNPVVITSRIVGGRDATRFEFPYMVKIIVIIMFV